MQRPRAVSLGEQRLELFAIQLAADQAVTMMVDERYALEQAAHCSPAVRSGARTKSAIGLGGTS